MKRNLYGIYSLLNGMKDDVIAFFCPKKPRIVDKVYWEIQEDVLFVHLFAHGMKSVYQPNIKVFHVGSSSMKQLHPKEIRKRLLFQIANLKEALHHLLDVMSEYESH